VKKKQKKTEKNLHLKKTPVPLHRNPDKALSNVFAIYRVFGTLNLTLSVVIEESKVIHF
jgi:hypothetical protein